MASITIKPEEFPDLVVSFLLDKIINSDSIIPENDEFNEYMERITRMIEPATLQYYLDMNASQRINYKRIKKVFIGKKIRNSIIIEGGSE